MNLNAFIIAGNGAWMAALFVFALNYLWKTRYKELGPVEKNQ